MRNEAIERRLCAWAAWFNGGGACEGGWPMKNILHPSWLPPSGGSTPTPATVRRGDADEREMHDAIGVLSANAIATIVVHYCKRWPLERQAEALGCSPSSIGMRVDRAHQRLAQILRGG